MTGKDEVSDVAAGGREEAWATRVWDACGGRCSNCGATDRLKARKIVPEEAGGREVVSNGMLLCRACELAQEIEMTRPQLASGERTRPINFFVGKGLYDRMKGGLTKDRGFRSVSALIRYLMGKFVLDPDRFDDLELYQEGGADVKVNVWVDRDIYGNFKALANRNGMTVTDTLKGLIRMYERESQRVREV